MLLSPKLWHIKYGSNCSKQSAQKTTSALNKWRHDIDWYDAIILYYVVLYYMIAKF